MDIYNKAIPQTVAIDVAYVGMDSDLAEICNFNEDFQYLDYYEDGVLSKLDVKEY